MMTDDLNPLWKALSDPTRRHILDLLRQAPRTTGQLSDAFADEMSRYAVMKHLTVLQEANLITIRRKGRERYNHLNFVPLQQMVNHWIRPFEAEWATSLINLKNQAEGAVNMTAPTQENAVIMQQIEQEIIINASAEKVFESLLDINGWWANRFTEYPDGLRLEAKVGGRFWETRDGSDDNGYLWGTVTSIEPNDHIQISGSIGMQGGALNTVVICTNPQDDGTTQLTISHHYMGQEIEGFLEGFRHGWKFGTEVIKKLAETGERVQLPPKK
ncbi:MAG: metalloregulator ArsR/SmtB family transcription factor [Phototrophicaceae bacterium]